MSKSHARNVLVVDVGGSHVKIIATGQTESRQFKSGPTLRPKQMIREIHAVTKDWSYDVVSIGYPGPALRNRPIAEPYNLGHGWVGFDYEGAFRHPVKLINDAAMQAVGSYKGGKLLFLGLGTGLGSAMILDGIVQPLELAHLPYKKHEYEYYVGRGGSKRDGKHKWRRRVADVVARLIAALQPDDVVLGGGNVKYLAELPPGCRKGENANAFVGGFRLWDDAASCAVQHRNARDQIMQVRRKNMETTFEPSMRIHSPRTLRGKNSRFTRRRLASSIFESYSLPILTVANA